MITFKQHLVESRSAPLYHGTAMEYADNILRIGFVPSTYHSASKIYVNTKTFHDGTIPRDRKGVSFTRKLKFASEWGKIILQVDQQALSSRYKIVPVNYFMGRGTRGTEMLHVNSNVNEYEEFVITEKPILPKYITQVMISKDHLTWQTTRERWEALQAKYPNMTFKVIE